MTNKELYKELCEKEYIPIFSQYWWMDAVCGKDNWDVLLSWNKDIVTGALPFFYKKKYGFKYILQPKFTQTNGVWFNYPKNKVLSEYERLSFEKKVCNDLINQLEKLSLSFYQQNFNYTITNWLPFYWRGFKQTTRYTYQITDITDLEKCFAAFTYAKRKQIAKAQKILHADYSIDGNTFYDNLEKNLIKKGDNPFYTRNEFLNLYDACVEKENGFIISILDNHNVLHASLFIVHDNLIAYNLISSINPELNSSGASTLAVWEAIKQVAGKVKIFDFEGSMDEGIENSFRQFGTIQTPYFQIEKSYSKIFKLFFDVKLKKSIPPVKDS